EIVRIRAHKVRAFPFERIVDRRQDAARAVWEVAASIDSVKAAKLKTAGVTLAYLSTAVRNRLFRQLRSDLDLKEATVIDDFGEGRFQLVPKIARESFETALAQVDTMADPCEVLIKREAMLEVARAYFTAPMQPAARAVLRWRIAGASGAEMRRRSGRSGPTVYALLREARNAVRDQIQRIREGV
ncbi:MAG: hypothetical protein AAB295_09155, partial [Chloroflexota bacterium]